MEIDLSVVLVGLLVYLLGIVTPNHHTEKTVKSFGAGVVQVFLIIFTMVFYPRFIRWSIGGPEETYYELAIVVCITLFSMVIIATRYYVIEDIVRQYSIVDVIDKVR